MKLTRFFSQTKQVQKQGPIYLVNKNEIYQYVFFDFPRYLRLEEIAQNYDTLTDYGLMRIDIENKNVKNVTKNKVRMFHHDGDFYYFLQDKDSHCCFVKYHKTTREISFSDDFFEPLFEYPLQYKIMILETGFLIVTEIKVYFLDFNLHCEYQYTADYLINKCISLNSNVVFSYERMENGEKLVQHSLKDKQRIFYEMSEYFENIFDGKKYMFSLQNKNLILCQINRQEITNFVLLNSEQKMIRTQKENGVVLFCHPDKPELLLKTAVLKNNFNIVKFTYKNWEKESLLWEKEYRIELEYRINDEISPLYWEQLHRIVFCGTDYEREGLIIIDIENGEVEFFKLTGYLNGDLSNSVVLQGETAYVNTLTEKGTSHFYKLE